MTFFDQSAAPTEQKKIARGCEARATPGYVNGLDYFISPKYVNACTKDEEFRSWREFFRQVSVKDAPDNGVEDFAMNFAIERLQALFNSIEAVDKRNFGYDLQALDQKSEKVHIEVKGLCSDGSVRLLSPALSSSDEERENYFWDVNLG